MYPNFHRYTVGGDYNLVLIHDHFSEEKLQ